MTLWFIIKIHVLSTETDMSKSDSGKFGVQFQYYFGVFYTGSLQFHGQQMGYPSGIFFVNDFRRRYKAKCPKKTQKLAMLGYLRMVLLR